MELPHAPITETPTAIQIDASAHCQLACPLCPTADGRARTGLGQGHLKLADFEALLDRNPSIAHVELSNYGEMFLNPQLPQILASAHERHVTVSGGNGVNLNHASEEALEAVVKYQVRTLTCSIDGASQETYATYRVNGNLERVLAHVDTIRELRRVQRSAFPLLDWQFVVFGHNEHEIKAARAMASQRGMGFLPRLSWDGDQLQVRNPDLVRIETGLGAASREEYLQNNGVGYGRKLCLQLWHQPVLNWDGRMMGCCVNHWQDFGGNAFSEGLAAAASHPSMNYARQMLTGHAESRPEIPCTRCEHYAELRESGTWLTEQEIARSTAPGHVVGIVPEESTGMRFAHVSVICGDGPTPIRETHGRLFRFGIDTAVYFAPRRPGLHTVFLRTLGSAGWSETLAWRLAVVARPLCQQWNLQLAAASAASPAAESEPAGKGEPVWIR